MHFMPLQAARTNQVVMESISRTARNRFGDTVVGTFVDAVEADDAVGILLEWARNRDSRTVALYNAHSAVTALQNRDLADALRSADMVLADGAPIAWMLRRKGFSGQERVAGPDLMLKLCEAAQRSSVGIFLFGSSESTLPMLRRTLVSKYPRLRITGSLSPRFGQWTEAEAASYADTINRSGAAIVFVGLGCPKQEVWIANHTSAIRGVVLGVGAAFDFHGGAVRRAPEFMRKTGFEWLHRLISEPRRLWRRYLITNTLFLWFATRDLLRFYF